ncbi:hypothetical protein CRM90_28445 [Mycobacterium sp. ENV421]|uniref:hypothetical protein n=1 Tax=Mycobacterium sp. ENV421 TaxID=1213407 RepID=UPI000C9B1A31|nr:hypothetical protein [Mycobacterium sp. ENV421]PND54345.1 hypothetical protein CRM90_28445 [Mycobacterium sp. ENV421]
MSTEPTDTGPESAAEALDDIPATNDTGEAADGQDSAAEPEVDFVHAFTPATDTDGQDADADPDADGQDDTDEPASRREARYRTKLRAAEEEAAQLRSTVSTMLSAEAERLAASTLRDGSDIWRAGATLDDVLDTDGTIDQGKVTELARSLVRDHPHWSIHAKLAAGSGLRSGASVVQEPRVSNWQKAFTPRSEE